MSKQTVNSKEIGSPQAQLHERLRMVRCALERIHNMIITKPIHSSAYAAIDVQAARAIGWLASVRSLCIANGDLSDPHFEDGELWDLDDEVVLALNAEDVGGKGGGM